jgi:hypothetical protein
MEEASFLPNCFWRRGTLSDTLKKSIASHVQASHLPKGQHVKTFYRDERGAETARTRT